MNKMKCCEYVPWSLTYCGAPESFFTRVGSVLTYKNYIILERPASEKHSSLLGSFIIYEKVARTHKHLIFFLTYEWV